MSAVGSKSCFIISPIGLPDTPVRQRADKIFSVVISPVLQELGYRGLRADHINAPGLITNQMISQLVDSLIVIADLSDHNPNVFYELAIRHALHKPIVQMIEEGQTIPFDVAGTRTIYFTINSELGVERVREQLKSQILSIEDGTADLDTPLSVGLRAMVRAGSSIVGTIGQIANMPKIHFFRNVNEVYDALYICCENCVEADGRLLVKNIGLDWETTWPRLRYDILDTLRFKSLKFQGLVIDPTDELIRLHCSDMISHKIAENMLSKIVSYWKAYGHKLRAAGVSVEIRAYSALPFFHGFLVNDRYLFISYTEPREEGLSGGDGVYHYCEAEPGNDVIASYFSYFALGSTCAGRSRVVSSCNPIIHSDVWFYRHLVRDDWRCQDLWYTRWPLNW